MKLAADLWCESQGMICAKMRSAGEVIYRYYSIECNAKLECPIKFFIYMRDWFYEIGLTESNGCNEPLGVARMSVHILVIMIKL
jgi:hypothetical protein